MRDNAREAWMNTEVTFFNEIQYMDGPVVGRPTRTYLHQLCEYSGCSLEELPGATDDRNGWREGKLGNLNC